MDNLEQIVAAALSDFDASQDPPALENAKAKYLGSTRTVRDTFYWLNGDGGFTSLWDAATYRAYKAHRCPTHSSPTVLP